MGSDSSDKTRARINVDAATKPNQKAPIVGGSSDVADADVATMRRFNRFYTRHIGVLQEGLLESTFSLTQSRVLYEIANRATTTATELASALDIDAGYLSRILSGLVRQKLVVRARAREDNRHYNLSLSAAGQRAFASLDTHSHAQASHTLDALPPNEQRRLIGSMQAIESILGRDSTQRDSSAPAFVLRDPLPGDFGWIVHRQTMLYANEYGFNRRFEALILQVTADFAANFDAACERCWIAERDGAIVGAVFLVRKSKYVAKLRMLYVESSARGLGLGQRLVQECKRHAKRVGFRTLTLWTHSILTSAIRIYEAEGFKLVSEEKTADFGPALTGQTWEVAL